VAYDYLEAESTLSCPAALQFAQFPFLEPQNLSVKKKASASASRFLPRRLFLNVKQATSWKTFGPDDAHDVRSCHLYHPNGEGLKSWDLTSRDLTTRHQIRSWAKRVLSSASIDSIVSLTNEAWPVGRKVTRRAFVGLVIKWWHQMKTANTSDVKSKSRPRPLVVREVMC